MRDLKALILAAGKGVRMKSDMPKVLFEAGGVPLLWYVIRAARAADVGETLTIVGVGRDLVRDCFRDEDVAWVTQEEQLGTGHAVACAREALSGFKGWLLVLYGDAPLIRPETLKALYLRAREVEASCVVLTSVLDDPAGYGRIVRGDSGIKAIVEEKCADGQEKEIREINSGIYCFRWEDLEGVLDAITDENPQGEYLLTDAVSLLLASGKPVDAVLSDDPAEGLGVNTRAQLAEVSGALRRRLCRDLAESGVTIVDPESAFIDPRARIGVDTVINPFVVIEGPVRIGRDCRIGPFTHIRGATELAESVHLGNFVEVKKSTLGSRSRARHLAFIGDAVVGEDVNIAAGVITANSDGRKTYVTEIGDGASVGSGTVLIAPCRLDTGAATGSGAVVTRNKVVPSGEVWVGMPAQRLERGGQNDG
ncbi:MAG: bifunctional UDP-N-acetylglucosamine diphosphorylase/glucosamine-1-phosphate N-acetyltransferase GlmU [Planctomycetota bacterium]|jgi:bifunctional UDP-N-acetylglucosamine pyrophosphorylase/glucosamine-1-phosphate N-acetyltransferase